MALTLVETLLPRTELPQDGARLDPANPLAQRFQVAYLPAVSGDNLGFGAQGAMPSHAQTRGATAAGPSVLFSAVTQAGRSFGPTPTYPMTFVVVARQTSTANASLVELAGASGLIGGASFRIGGGSSTTISLTARANFSSTATATATVPADANGNQALNQVMVIVGQSLSAADHRVCVNGSAVGTSTTSIGTLPAWDRLTFGTAAGNVNLSAALFGFGGAPLSDADMQRLSRSPSEVWALFEPQRVWVPVTAAGGGNAIAVPAGSLTLTGSAPTVAVTANQLVAVPLGELTLTGQTPTVLASDNQTIAVPAGSLTLTGQTPTVSVSSGNTIAVPAGTLSLTGFAPTVTATANNRIEVPLGTLTLTGNAPAVVTSGSNAIQVPTGTLTLTGNAPTVTVSANNQIAVPLGTLSLAGFAPTVTVASGAQVIAVPLGTLTLTGRTPTVIASDGTDDPLDGFAANSRITTEFLASSRITTAVALRSPLRN